MHPFADLGFKVVTGSRYLGGFVGEDAAMSTWLEKKLTGWKEAVNELAYAAKTIPQAAYCGLQKSLQAGWQFVQRVVEGIGTISHRLLKRFLARFFQRCLARVSTTETFAIIWQRS